ncbi:calcineurin-binding protein cabin-1-like [Clytia hemisphaerica]|uniref:Calcineurin-binding protein cabin-1 n=1 Tax=Clytia hemisphaerica TaxID=252671 RepID=A0A7M5XF70_9CNID
MLSFGALNATISEDSSSAIFHEVQKEEQEATALHLYNEALSAEKENSVEAPAKFKEVLECELLVEAPESLQEGEILSQNPALFLKYNVLKKLANIAEKDAEKEKAIGFFLEAALVDESDLWLWCKIGQLSMDVLNLRLARYAFEKGLVYSPNHWKCLDQLISVLYIVGDYHACLKMICHAFERNSSYRKGFAFRDQIFMEEPHFKKEFLSLSALYLSDSEDSEDEDKESEPSYQKFIEEALVIRGRRNLQAKREEPNLFRVTKPLPYYSWYCFSEVLLHIYHESNKENSEYSLGFSVDMSTLRRTPEQQANLPVPSPDVLAKKYAKSIRDTDGVKGVKRKKLVLTPQEKEMEPQPKRRSSRVSKQSKAKELDFNLNELVYSFLPSDFRPTADSEDSQESKASIEVTAKTPSQQHFGTTEDLQKESIAVSNFINKNVLKKTCITIMEEFLMALSDVWHHKWETRLTSKFIKIYHTYRKHTQLPNIFENDNLEYAAKIGRVILLGLELQLDSWLNQRSCGVKLSHSSPALDQEEMKTKFQQDFSYLSLLASNNDLLLNETKDTHHFVVRFFYLYGRSCMDGNQIPQATNAFYNCLDYLDSYGETFEDIVLHNCQTNNIINKENVDKMIERLNQSQTTDELQQIFDSKEYEKIVTMLEPCLMDQKVAKSKERPTQLYLLTQSYSNTSCHEKCFGCIKLILNEAMSNNTIVDGWKVNFNEVLKVLDSYFVCQEKKNLLSDNFVQSLCEQLAKLLEANADCESNDDCDVTTLPWLLIYRIIKWKNMPETSTQTSDQLNEEEVIHVDDDVSQGSEDSIDSTASSKKGGLQFLRTAHNHLARKHWCCHDDGVLLHCLVDELSSALHMSTGKEREALSKELEQCFYCLYGNPCKKIKTKLVVDHNVEAVSLSWKNSKVMYDFYTPNAIPQLNIKTHTISLEVQHVLKKITTVVPQKQVEVISFETLQHFIDGSGSLPSIDHEDAIRKKESCNGMEDLFYYLGDFYFKNKEFQKALKFYMHDVCLNPNRFQSWAAMAFTRASRLEEKLNECEQKSDGLVKKLITSTLRCFEKAIKINSKRCLILEEYGQTAYMINSYASRKLKGLKEKLDSSQLAYYAKLRKSMLLLTEKCFLDAFDCTTSKEGEQWLHLYMLGKTAEKLGKPPTVFLEYYQKSMTELYQSGGKFIKKITYRSPPQYSIESVEMFYRVHASIMKLLKYSENLNYQLMEEHLDRVTKHAIYLDILEMDNSVVKDYYNTCRSKDPIRLFLHELVDEICQKEENNIIQQECQVILDEILDKIAPSQSDCSKTPDSKPETPLMETDEPILNFNAPKAGGFSVKSTAEDSPYIDIYSNNMETCATNMEINDEPNMEIDEEPIQIEDSNDHCYVDPALKTAKDILDMIISKVCENTESNDDNDSKVVEEILKGLIDQVCEEDQDDQGVNTNINRTILNRDFASNEEKDRYLLIADRCLQGFGFCLRRFHEHYKSQYSMAYFLAHSPLLKNLQWSRDLLLGTFGDPSKYSIPLPNHGIFSGRKKTNMFQYIWRVPVNEIDRPGSFCHHNNQSTVLLLHVLYQLKDYPLLLHVSTFLHKTPDKERKYLRDEDRSTLANKAFDMVIEIMESKLGSEQVKTKKEWKRMLIDSHEAYKHSQKMCNDQKRVETLVLDVYRKFTKVNEALPEKEVLEEAIKFCQQLKC